MTIYVAVMKRRRRRRKGAAGGKVRNGERDACEGEKK